MQKKMPQGQVTYVKPEWKIWHSFLILLLVVAAGVMLALFSDTVQRPAGFLLLANVLQFAFFFLIPLYVAGVVYKQPPAALGMQARPLTHGLGKAAAWGVLLYTLNVLCAAVLFMLFPNQPQDMQFIMQAMLGDLNALELGGLIFCVTVLAPVGEEIFFRAFLFGAVEARFGRWAGVIVSALIFAAVHESVWNFPPMFVGGCGFALMYAKYRDISMNIVAHAVWNSIAVIMMFGLVYGQ